MKLNNIYKTVGFFVAIMIVFTSCGIVEETVLPTSESSTTEMTTCDLIVPQGLSYIPGSIKLCEVTTEGNLYWIGGAAEYWFKPTKRNIYYSIDSIIFDLADSTDDFDSWVNNFWNGWSGSSTMQDWKIEPTVMILAEFVKHYNISKNDFISAVGRIANVQKQFNQDSASELYELPNADVIYTFDNELINEYYRRE